MCVGSVNLYGNDFYFFVRERVWMCVGCVNLCVNDEYYISETYVCKHIHVHVYTIIHMYDIYVRILFVRVCGCVSDVLICV